MLGTEKCIGCGKRKATAHGGHVLRGRQEILAGWCEKCLKMKSKAHSPHGPNLLGRPGCYGGWHKRYGLKEP